MQYRKATEHCACNYAWGDLARSEMGTIREKMMVLEKQFNDLKEMVRKLEWRNYPSWLEAYAPKKRWQCTYFRGYRGNR